MGRGTLIVFEGLDRAGKSTQCVRLVETLRTMGHAVRHIQFPDRSTSTGQQIDSYLRNQSQQNDQAIHLLFSANRWEHAKSIEDDIAAGTVVIIDRYYYSGCVYSAAKGNPLLSLPWSRGPEEGLPRPDICVFLDIAESEAAKRGGYGGERYESTKMQQAVRSLFGHFRSKMPEAVDFVTIDGGEQIDEVADNVLKEVQDAIKRVNDSNPPLRRVEPWSDADKRVGDVKF